jgi:hypothetical protein
LFSIWIVCSYIYRNDKRYNDNDGLIFTPEDRPYRSGHDHYLFKWKWPPLRSADFVLKPASNKSVEENEKEFEIFLQGESGCLMRWQYITLPSKIKQQIAHLHNTQSQVFSLSFISLFLFIQMSSKVFDVCESDKFNCFLLV